MRQALYTYTAHRKLCKKLQAAVKRGNRKQLYRTEKMNERECWNYYVLKGRGHCAHARLKPRWSINQWQI